MKTKVLIPLFDDSVAPRFDLATDVLVARLDATGAVAERKLLILPQASAERLCQLVLAEAVAIVVCGGIEAEHYDYLTWKQVRVIDNVIGSVGSVLARLKLNQLECGDILREQTDADG
ncbi:MAG: dinitrogenase iron-molybdenum cofactor biosynthesis protein [Clostridia bacterium]|nr:dinitrogenase iron-molybdenum cofactor biosynthesis protein [Clostridia bacterium]